MISNAVGQVFIVVVVFVVALIHLLLGFVHADLIRKLAPLQGFLQTFSSAEHVVKLALLEAAIPSGCVVLQQLVLYHHHKVLRRLSLTYIL